VLKPTGFPELECKPVQKPIKVRMIKAKPASETHRRTAVNEIREIFKVLLSIDLSREIHSISGEER
jgi:hypothetical protein